MMCYKDMTFCGFYETCKHQSDCHRPLTEKVIKDAEEFGLPISQFTDKPECWEGEDFADNRYDETD